MSEFRIHFSIAFYKGLARQSGCPCLATPPPTWSWCSTLCTGSTRKSSTRQVKRDIISSRKYLFTTVCCHINKEVDRVLAPGGVAAFCVAFGMDIEMGKLPEFKEILLEKVTEEKN